MEAELQVVGPRIVRAWFDTLINKLRLLGERNFTGAFFRPVGFELIRKIHRHLDS